MQTTGPVFLVVGALLLPLSFLHRNPLRRQMLQLIAAFSIGVGVVFFLMGKVSGEAAGAILGGYAIFSFVFALWFGRRQLIVARRTCPTIYAERKRGAGAFLLLAIVLVAASLIGNYALGIRSLRSVWVGGVMLLSVYLWERACIRSLERKAHVSEQDP